MTTLIRHATLEDAAAIAAIYSYYIANTSFTFDTVLPSISSMRKRMIDCASVAPWFVAESDGAVIGYAHASKHRIKKSYDWSADVTIYIDHRHHRSGIATKLYHELFASLQKLGYHTAYAGITLPNDPSVRLHERLGFTLVGIYKEVGYKFDKWQNVGWWEKKLSDSTAIVIPIKISPIDPTAKNRGHYSLSFDSQRMISHDVHQMLLNTHWGKNRCRETIEKSIANSLCFGVFSNSAQIAFARVVTDYCTFAYLCDVVVHENHRGQGIGKWLMDEIMAHPDLQSLRRFILATRDAHSLYRKYGFMPFDNGEQERFMGLERNDNV